MSAGTGAAPGQVPPDLPSLLLDARICYIGMPVRFLSHKNNAISLVCGEVSSELRITT